MMSMLMLMLLRAGFATPGVAGLVSAGKSCFEDLPFLFFISCDGSNSNEASDGRICLCVSVCSQPMMVDFGDGVCSCVCRLVGWQIAIYSYLR